MILQLRFCYLKAAKIVDRSNFKWIWTECSLKAFTLPFVLIVDERIEYQISVQVIASAIRQAARERERNVKMEFCEAFKVYASWIIMSAGKQLVSFVALIYKNSAHFINNSRK